MDKTAELTTRFGLIDTNSNGKLEKSELVAVFGEHAEEFLKFCDAGEKDGVLTCEEFCAGIIEDTKEMSDDEFKANWLDRMSKCIEDAAPAASAAEPTAEAIGAVQAALKAEPAAALCCYKANSALVDGLCTSLTFPNTPEHGPYLVDEPPMMPGGKDRGPNPLDLCLGALGTCQEIAYKAYATAMGINLRSVACELNGEVDLAGFLGVEEGAPCGFTKITGTVTVDCDATDEQLAALKGAVDTHCPMCDFMAGDNSMSLTSKIASPDGLAEPDDEGLTAEAIGALQAALKADRAAGKVTYKSSSKLETGLQTLLSFPNTAQHGPYVIDEPETMPGGQNAGPNPLDLLLGSIGTCQDISYKAYATAMGIKLYKVETEMEGDVDLRGFLGVEPGVRAGFQAIRGTVKLYTNATEEQVNSLIAAAGAHCPMCATVADQKAPEIQLVKK